MKIKDFVRFNSNNLVWYKIKRSGMLDYNTGILYKSPDLIPYHVLEFDLVTFKVIPHNNSVLLIVCVCK